MAIPHARVAKPVKSSLFGMGDRPMGAWQDRAMEKKQIWRLWSGPPLAWQIVGLLVSGLVVAQLVTLFLTLLLPPEPQPQYGLGDIARALTGQKVNNTGGRPLQRIVQAGPPALSGPGWLTSERSRHDLAMLLVRDEQDVRLAFYTPLPFAGTANAPQRRVEIEAPQRQAEVEQPEAEPAQAQDVQPDMEQENPSPSGFIRADFQLAQAGPTPGGFPGGFPGRFPSGPPPGSFPSGAPPMTAPSLGPQSIPVAPAPPLPQGAAPQTTAPQTMPAPSLPQAPAQIFPTQGPSGGVTSAPPTIGGPPSGPISVGPGNISPGGPSSINPGSISPGGGGPVSMPSSGPPVGGQTLPSLSIIAPPLPAPAAPQTVPSPSLPAAPPQMTSAPAPLAPARPDTATTRPAEIPPAATTPPQAQVTAPQSNSEPESDSASDTVPVQAPPRGLFGLAPAPFVEGDFVAALRLEDGNWAVVQPVPEAFPNSWQRRVLLWFLISFGLVAPLGWIFARRVVRPIAGFAVAAERLGRDPTAPVLALEGPAEVGRAAHAFNRMQSRLRSFVDDRTAFVGAISHDLRTPLTRLRFRIEDVPDEMREGMLAEVDEMEQMISSVLSFIRDASEPGSRERLDLRSLLEDVVEDAVFVGKDVTLEGTQSAQVEVDALGMRRLLGNLVENAVKYGDKAWVRLFTDQSEAVAEIRDDGPGLPEEELERVFQPFYRAPAARASTKHGTGLGLAVCRSIARAHGGDVRLTRGDHGLIAQVRLPLVYGAA
jgi:signal transduction histidine kinase